MSIQQQTLWDMPQEQPSCIPVPDLGGIIEWPMRWADGDSRLEELERLARVVIGKPEFFKASNGEHISCRVIAARVEGDHVMMVLKRIEPPIKGYVTWLKEQGQTATDGDDE